MNRKSIYGISVALVLSATIALAAEDSAVLRSELNALTKRLEELENKPAPGAKSDWTERVSIKGDMRARFENVEIDSNTSKSRFRGRARIGAYAEVNDQVYAGMRIATGSDESPTSTNQSSEDFGNKRAIWLNLMYMGYTPDAINDLNLILGKIKQPWEQVSDLMYDGDVAPEGVNAGYNKKFGDVSLIANLGYFTWQDKANDNPAVDVTMGAGQLASIIEMGDHLELTGGVNAFIYRNIEGSEIPISESDNGTTKVENTAGDTNTVQVVNTKILNKGNTTDGEGNWFYGYELIEGFLQLDIKNDYVPVKLYGDYINNIADGVAQDQAWLIGFGLKYKKLSFDYNYRDLEADSIIGVLADGDFAGGGTGGEGHKFKLKYTLLKNWSAGLTYFITENMDGKEINTAQIDLAVKF
ncbi:MAG: putative porin [Kiritimatiellaceae bacterium]|nr:putative porin [Kiritimatiellaceae bacterium]